MCLRSRWGSLVSVKTCPSPPRIAAAVARSKLILVRIDSSDVPSRLQAEMMKKDAASGAASGATRHDLSAFVEQMRGGGPLSERGAGGGVCRRLFVAVAWLFNLCVLLYGLTFALWAQLPEKTTDLVLRRLRQARSV